MSMSVIIPVRDREVWRIEEIIKRLQGELIKEIIVVDYFSKEPIEVSGDKIKVIRYEKKGPWNKAHAINIGYKNSSSDFIMTIDVDILPEDDWLDKIILDSNSYTYTGDVKRLQPDKVSDDFEYMWTMNSFPWSQKNTYDKAMYGLANGGIQIYPRRLLEFWTGIDENLVYSGGMDNITNLMAKKIGMNVIQLPIKILHIEHDSKKFDNYPEEERDLATFLGLTRGQYLNEWIANPIINKFCGELSGPCYSKYLEQLKLYMSEEESIKRQNLVMKNRDKRIMIAIINNNNTFDYRFMKSIFDMYLTTIDKFPNADLRFIKACQVNHMRNIAVDRSIKEEYDYLIQLDTDHIYEEDTVIRLMADDKDFVTVPTKMRVAPFYPTQFYEFKTPLKQIENMVHVTGRESELIKIECSGPVAMLMKVEALKKLKFPYYYMDYSYGLKDTMGGDYKFCQQLKEKGFDLYLNPTINCNHFVRADVSSFGEDAEISIDDGSM